jgi:hypothetical protein
MKFQEQNFNSNPKAIKALRWFQALFRMARMPILNPQPVHMATATPWDFGSQIMPIHNATFIKSLWPVHAGWYNN